MTEEQPQPETSHKLHVSIMPSSNDKDHEQSHITISDDGEGADPKSPKSAGLPRSSSGWDGKLRVEKKVELFNPEALSDPEYSDEENVLEGDQIQSDGDLLNDYPPDTTEIDCNHSRISSITSLNLSRFPQIQRLCLRQNTITEITSLSPISSTLTDLDLYDNLIAHVRNLDDLVHLTNLDLSFNKIKHIKNISHLTSLTDLYFVQNKISTIEGLTGLNNLRNLELAANRIREIQGLESLQALEELWLGKNKITSISGIDTLQSLKILSIQSNRIRNISGLSNLPHLEELYISHNALSTLDGLENSIGLRVLDISNNAVKSVKGLKHLEHLEELWASYNQIADWNETEDVLKGRKELTTVYFEGNPLQFQNPATYRNKVRLMLPQVMQIDATYVRVS